MRDSEKIDREKERESLKAVLQNLALFDLVSPERGLEYNRQNIFVCKLYLDNTGTGE